MVRTTVEIDDPVLLDLKRLQKKEGKSLGRLMTELLIQGSQPGEEADSEATTVHVDLQEDGAALGRSDRQGGSTVTTLYTNDSDFRRFDFLTVKNPFT